MYICIYICIYISYLQYIIKMDNIFKGIKMG